MSLRVFHLGFISMAILFCLATSYRSFQLAQIPSTMPFQTMGSVSLLMAMLLLAYSAWCLKTRKTNFLPAILFSLITFGSDAQACGVCYGDKASTLVQSANQGGVVLLGLAVAMIAGYVGYGAYLISISITQR